MKGLNATPFRVTDAETGEWIEIKPVLSRGDMDWIESQVLAVKLQSDGATAEVKALNRPTLLLERAIVGWYLTDAQGAEFPFRRDNIARLPQDSELIDRVLEEIVERNPIRRVLASALPGVESESE